MSHFAKIDKDNIVIDVVVAEQDFINSGAVGDSFLWIQTSYSGSFRKQFAGVGMTYDRTNDVFIEEQPYPSWTLDSDYNWQPPTARPDDDDSTPTAEWNETDKTWEVPSE